MATKGRKPWIAKVPSAELQAVHERIDSREDEPPDAIFAALNLARYTTVRTFRAYAEERRRERDWRDERTAGAEGPHAGPHPDPLPGGEGGAAASPGGLLSRLLQSCLDAVNSGRMPAYAIPGAMQAAARVSELEYSAAAEKRAAELHEEKMRELRKRQDAALSEMATPAALTAEQVAEIRLKVLGL